MLPDAIREFVDLWGNMGSMWGINPSVARVHALLMASEEGYTMEELGAHLDIAKSNVSMCLKELRSWGVVRRVPVSGERRDRYMCEPDVWRMLFNIARERKRREFEPALSAVRDVVGRLERPTSDDAAPVADGFAVDRLRELERLFSTMDRVATRALENDGAARTLLAFIAGR